MTPALVLFAHPALERARINPTLARAAAAVEGVRVRDLYELYPDFAVDVRAEQQALAEAELVVLQFPLYWYAAPALVKEWLDLVLTHGWAYGATGRALAGKTLACAVSAGGGERAYGPGGRNRFSVAEFLRPFEQTADLCRMRWVEPFVVYGAAVLRPADLEAETGRYRAWLERTSAAAGAA